MIPSSPIEQSSDDNTLRQNAKLFARSPTAEQLSKIRCTDATIAIQIGGAVFAWSPTTEQLGKISGIHIIIVVEVCWACRGHGCDEVLGIIQIDPPNILRPGESEEAASAIIETSTLLSQA